MAERKEKPGSLVIAERTRARRLAVLRSLEGQTKPPKGKAPAKDHPWRARWAVGR